MAAGRQSFFYALFLKKMAKIIVIEARLCHYK